RACSAPGRRRRAAAPRRRAPGGAAARRRRPGALQGRVRGGGRVDGGDPRGALAGRPPAGGAAVPLEDVRHARAAGVARVGGTGADRDDRGAEPVPIGAAMRWAVIVVVLLSACKREERAAPT